MSLKKQWDPSDPSVASADENEKPSVAIEEIESLARAFGLPFTVGYREGGAKIVGLNLSVNTERGTARLDVRSRTTVNARLR